jgi:glycosyltransferase involved in cell wall biosynthesis
MSVIFITIPWFSPAYKAGGPIQSIANMVNELQEGYEFYIFCGDTDLDGIALANIVTGEWINYNAYTKIWYAPKADRSNILTEEVKKIQPDILYSVGMFSWYFTMVPMLFCKEVKKILSVRGMLHPGALSQKKIKKQWFLEFFKLCGLHKKIIFHATDETEKTFVENAFGEDVTIKVAGNFPRLFSSKKANDKKAGTLQLITVALISPMKNIGTVLEALEHCKAAIEYTIYGPIKDGAYWQQCLLQIKRLPANCKVRYNGDVQPQLVQEVLQTGNVFILPSKSENFGHAIIEALSAGLPVISSHAIPWQQLEDQQAGINTDATAAALSKAIDFFAAMETGEFEKWSAGATAYAINAIDVNVIKNEYNQLFAV